MKAHVLVVPSWWPSPEQPLAGIFHRDYVHAFAAAGARVGVVVPDLVSLSRVRPASPPPIWPRVALERAGEVPVIRIRGLHTALRRPRLHMRRFLAWLQRGYRLYRERFGRPDLVHAHCAIPAGWAALHLDPDAPLPVIITENTGPFALALAPPAAGAMTRLALRRAAVVVAVSPHLRAQIHAAGIDRPINVIPNPVATGFTYAPAPPAGRTPHGTPLFKGAFVGRMVRDKGVFELADAILRLAAHGQVAVCWNFAGDGPDAAAVRARLARLSPPHEARFLGLCDKPRILDLLHRSHFLVLPSHYENCPLAIAEARCVGRPVVATRDTGCEAWVGPHDGVLCRPHDPASLAAAVADLLNPFERWDAADIARRGGELFAPAAIAARYAPLVASVCGQA